MPELRRLIAQAEDWKAQYARANRKIEVWASAIWIKALRGDLVAVEGKR